MFSETVITSKPANSGSQKTQQYRLSVIIISDQRINYTNIIETTKKLIIIILIIDKCRIFEHNFTNNETLYKLSCSEFSIFDNAIAEDSEVLNCDMRYSRFRTLCPSLAEVRSQILKAFSISESLRICRILFCRTAPAQKAQYVFCHI